MTKAIHTGRRPVLPFDRNDPRQLRGNGATPPEGLSEETAPDADPAAPPQSVPTEDDMAVPAPQEVLDGIASLIVSVAPTPTDDRVDDELGDDLAGFASETPASVLDDAEELRLDPNENIQESVKIHGPVPVRTMPGKQVYFRVMPGDEWRFGTVMHIDEDLGPFIVTKGMRQYVEDVRPYVIVLCITSKGVEFFWPLPLPQESENSLSKEWSGSKRRAAALAETKWIKVKSNKPANCWDHFQSKGNLDEPVWSGRTFKEMFDSAFADKIIRDVGHPVIKRQQEG